MKCVNDSPTPLLTNRRAAGQTVWDPEQGMFVHINPSEQLKEGQAPLNTLAKEPYFT